MNRTRKRIQSKWFQFRVGFFESEWDVSFVSLYILQLATIVDPILCVLQSIIVDWIVLLRSRWNKLVANFLLGLLFFTGSVKYSSSPNLLPIEKKILKKRKLRQCLSLYEWFVSSTWEKVSAATTTKRSSVAYWIKKKKTVEWTGNWIP